MTKMNSISNRNPCLRLRIEIPKQKDIHAQAAWSEGFTTKTDIVPNETLHVAFTSKILFSTFLYPGLFLLANTEARELAVTCVLIN